MHQTLFYFKQSNDLILIGFLITWPCGIHLILPVLMGLQSRAV